MNITQSLSRIASEAPNTPAVFTAEDQLTYDELDRAVSWMARSYSKQGLNPGDIVGIRLENQVQHMMASLALARMGAGQFAFHPTDPPRIQQELVRRLEIVATISNHPNSADLETPIIGPPSDRLRDFKIPRPVEFAAADDGGLPFILLPTSGTETGLPKVGVLNHANAVGRLQPLILDGPASRFHSITNINFHGAKQDMFRCFIYGSCLALFEAKTAHTLVDLIAKHRINYLAGSPVHADTLLKAANENSVQLPGVEALRLSSTLVPDILRREIQERLTPNLYIAFGITEIGKITVAEPEIVKTIPGVVGKALPGVHLKITDDEGEILPPGQSGCLWVNAAGMLKGYIGEPEGSDEAFRDGWFQSGDLAEFTTDGQLIHHGRADDMMILDGINIFPAEIENVLLRHPAVVEAAAFPLRSVARGELPVAAVVTGAAVTEKALIKYCRSWLGPRTPERIVILTRLPKNAVGKVLKHELELKFAQPLARVR